ncbi:IS5 family transposase [Microvirga brassicacearum]|uniref:IS5 family transposase n=1 Tax=Microvirga brassicacearum TaxID=2580413 RepID=A0A5N3PC67_9HYPH|nr:IS5 family transposase [Microvirga brassicacearum]KAB0267235.1 IS5 family transposase [Microvirga brassicacearum]
MANEFWLSDAQWLAIEPHLPKNQPGARRVDDRRVLSGIIHVQMSGCRGRDCPPVYGPYTTIYNRWNRWSRRKLWQRLFEALRQLAPDDDFHAIDSTTAKAHRSAAGEKGGPEAQAIGRSRGGRTTKIHAVCDPLGRPIALEVSKGQLGDIRAALPLLGPLPPARLCAADTAYDANGLRQFLAERGTTPVIPNNPTRRRVHPFDRQAYKRRNLVERMFYRLKDWRRIATRYDKLARNFRSAVALAALVLWWA